MAEQAQTLPAVRPPRQYIEVIGAIPIYSTDKFEHMSRIATAMARASLIPDHLKVIDDQGLNVEATFGNCLMIVNQAINWDMDPWAVAQCTSIVMGRLCYEGKLIAAVIENKLKVRLKYEWYGDKGTDGYGIRITHPERPEEMIEGCVGDWKTHNKDRTDKANWVGNAQRLQLKYRGDREWSRAWAPGILLGVYAPDEFDDLEADARARRAQPVIAGTGLAGRLTERNGAGFSAESIRQQLGPNEKLDPETGEITNTGVGLVAVTTSVAPARASAAAGAAGPSKASPEVRPTTTASDNSSSDAGAGAAAAAHTATARPATASAGSEAPHAQSRAEGGGGEPEAPRLSPDLFREFSQRLGRYESADTITKGHEQFWKEKGGKPKTAEDSELARAVLGQHLHRAKGLETIAGIEGWLEGAIEKSFGEGEL